MDDQTPKKWRDLPPNMRGTAVLLSYGASGEPLVSFRPNVTYEQLSSGLGRKYGSFKWVPSEVATFAEVMNSVCEIRGEPCRTDCKAYGCMCDRRVGRCIDSTASAKTGGSGPLTSEYRRRDTMETA